MLKSWYNCSVGHQPVPINLGDFNTDLPHKLDSDGDFVVKETETKRMYGNP
jgi:hypothetical protein